MVPETCSASLNKDNFLLLNRRLLLPHPRISIYQKDSVNEAANLRYQNIIIILFDTSMSCAGGLIGRIF